MDSFLNNYTKQIRIEALRMIYHSPAGHPGGALSMAEIISVLYFGDQLNLDPDRPQWPERDRVVLSKGHGCAALYAALGLKGFFSTKEFKKFRHLDGLLEGHPSISIPGIDAPSGSLGMGLSQGLGMALGSRYTENDYRVYVVLGDGDMQEGSTWEAIMAAGFHKVGNLCAILDYNNIQQDGYVKETMDYSPIFEKLDAFHWDVSEVNGHNCEEIQNAIISSKSNSSKPSFIIANTIKGKGVSFMENNVSAHGTVPLSKEDFAKARAEIEKE